MDAMVIGIDVSKDRLDVAVRPTGESLIFKRTGVGDRRSHRPAELAYIGTGRRSIARACICCLDCCHSCRFFRGQGVV
jgi:hypothetical protein